jgi:hypothetical protein
MDRHALSIDEPAHDLAGKESWPEKAEALRLLLTWHHDGVRYGSKQFSPTIALGLGAHLHANTFCRAWTKRAGYKVSGLKTLLLTASLSITEALMLMFKRTLMLSFSVLSCASSLNALLHNNLFAHALQSERQT